ncbi:rhodanese-like domain-containing protein [Cyanobium sp. Copco_Reservoir_LC18]|uniref:rhodanese-like domain-containing protein n=1 Tax=Cyanobium sp. Copco_Reservoir_LC18 TaxID=1328305 RepID=UPI00135ABBBA|nr:rhodanese-like domain-containing protein [Cyanobium sp. Copco_Reservoir_LC18]
MSLLHGSNFLQRAEAARSQIREVDANVLKSLMADGATVIDVREPEEFEAGHIPGAINVRASILSQQVPKILKDRSHPVVVVCAGGNRSALAVLELQGLAYTTVASLQTGLRDWPDPLVRPVSAGC